MLYDRDKYLNKNIPYIISNEIIEYDIRSAGFNITKKYKLLSQSKIDYLESLDKKARHIAIGLIQRNNKEYRNVLKDKFRDIRRLFFEANNLNDEDILSIKKDALFVFKPCINLTFDNVEFVKKNVYSSFYYINKYEFYIGNKVIHVKGINDNKLIYHKEYMLDFLYSIFKMLENGSEKKAVKELVLFANYYKKYQLEMGYYRELNDKSMFRLKKDYLKTGSVFIEFNIDSLDYSLLNIDYNYNRYVIPLIGILT